MGDKRVIYTGTDETYSRDEKDCGLQIVASTMAARIPESLPYTFNHHEGARDAIRAAKERWFDGAVYGDYAMRFGLIVTDDKPNISGKGDNFGLVFPTLFRHYARGRPEEIEEVVAAFDGEVFSQSIQTLRLGLNGWPTTILKFVKPSPSDITLKTVEPSKLDRIGINMVVNADIAVKILKRRMKNGDGLLGLLCDPRMAGLWFDGRAVPVDSIDIKHYRESKTMTVGDLLKECRKVYPNAL